MAQKNRSSSRAGAECVPACWAGPMASLGHVGSADGLGHGLCAHMCASEQCISAWQLQNSELLGRPLSSVTACLESRLGCSLLGASSQQPTSATCSAVPTPSVPAGTPVYGVGPGHVLRQMEEQDALSATSADGSRRGSTVCVSQLDARSVACLLRFLITVGWAVRLRLTSAA